MDEVLLLKELKAIIEESVNRGIKVVVIGAFCVKALDLNSQNSFPIRDEKKVFIKSNQVGFGIAALSLSGLLITKLIALRENDIVDIVSILTNKFDALSSQELYLKAEGSNNLLSIRRRLIELRELIESNEIDAIWYIRANQTFPAEEKTSLLGKVNKLLKPFTV